MKKTGIFLLIFGIAFGSFAQQKPAIKTVEWSKNATIYEVNVRQFSESGTFKAVEAKLPELKELGVGILWLMPINPIGEKNRKLPLGSYYAVRNYTGINPEFGTEAHFHDLIKKAHELGMKVIIDWVANHTAWDHPWVLTNPEYYTKNSKGEMIAPVEDWADVADLDYSNQGLRKDMIESMKYWVEEFDLDGFRCDVAGMVPVEFWDSARKELDKVKPVFMLAEAHEPELHNHAFDMTYGWQFKDYFNNIAQGKHNADSLRSYLVNKETKMYHPDNYRMLFITNHDENTWNGNEFKRLGDAYQVMTVLTFTLPGMPLIYNGQEAGMTQELKFFEKDPIQWKDHSNKALYKKLTSLRLKHSSLWSGEYGGNFKIQTTSDDQNAFSFSRKNEEDEIQVVVNLTGKEMEVTLKSTGFVGKSEELLTGETINLNSGLKVKLAPWSWKIWGKK
ncbi:MAG: alpha-amylase [Bacteroidetes bacterium]|nr:alpha-amylase [Bacteroidota bacterium]